jgi:hypothetical protein
MRGMLPIRPADGQMPVAAVIGNLNDYPAHAGSVLGHHGQSIKEANQMISKRLALDQDR